jgi:hypothetical protein
MGRRAFLMAVDRDEHVGPRGQWYGAQLAAEMEKSGAAGKTPRPVTPEPVLKLRRLRRRPAVQAYELKHGEITSIAVARIVADRKCRPVRCIETGKCYRSAAAAAQAVKGFPGNIKHCCEGIKSGYRTVCGLRWEWCDVADLVKQMEGER